ncbi:MAG: NADH-quinone oxidoreductase subunit C [Saprospiraceae bacterium]|mgnify:CR=1 FL=1|nr:NADH-quinone oxidoreductase subunit C [Saprospiraceae bacterium]
MNTLNLDQITKHIHTNLEDSFNITEDAFGIYNCTIPIQQLYRLVQFLFKDTTLSFQFLTDICGVHYPDHKNQELAVVYHLQSMQNKARFRIKIWVPIDKPEVPSITGIYASANWMERETYDFYGIQFLGHPNLKRILNMDEMTAFPLRKEFPLEDPTREDKADFQFGR